MTTRLLPLRLVSLDDDHGAAIYAEPLGKPLGVALAGSRYLLREPLPPGWGELPLQAFQLEVHGLTELPLDEPVFDVSGQPVVVPGPAGPGQPAPAEPPAEMPARAAEIDERSATEVAYHLYVQQVASLLRADLSVLVTCDKIVVPYLAEHIVNEAGRSPRLLVMPRQSDDEQPPAEQRSGPMASIRQRLLSALRDLLRVMKDDEVLVITHLDLLGGGSDSGLASESRDLVELLYGSAGQVVLAFADPSLAIPEVLAARFAVRVSIEGSPRYVVRPSDDRELPIERVLVTESEAARFAGIDSTDFYKYVAGLNPVRLRQAMRYAYQVTEGRDRVTVADLRDTIRTFKAQLSSSFEIPDVSFDDIGGYEDVKRELRRAIEIMATAYQLPEEDSKLRGELLPRGVIFYGPPGTGKTLFAKAIANHLNATIQVVSGPEVTNKYVGEGERRVRELFAEARRNAPSVIVFDEFDSIAARRSSWDDGGSRAGNAMVAQILTEMDGFRPDVPMLVVGTTNRLELIDEALLRPSRFASYQVKLPDDDARRAIIGVHSRRYRVDVTGLVEALVRATNNWNGDEIRALFRDAYVGERWEGIAVDETRLGTLVGNYQRMKRGQREDREARG